MPLYEYKCTKCKKKYELLHGYNVEPVCEKCGRKLKRLISQTSFILKGDGWTR